ncbi:MAG: AAA family ATPase [Bacilli bacterium]|nr:AAA family ATPase [Bacilli bacterium]
MKLITQIARPKRIEDVAGQELAKQALLSIAKKPYDSPRVIILHGTYGVGKTSLARAFARALNCQNQNNGDACGKCYTCSINIEDTEFYEEYDSSIIGNVEDIKKLREFFNFNSDQGYRVITIDEAHLLSRQAQSSLLKVFEEVNSRVFFILCTTEKDKLLSTIQSRSMDIRLNKVPDSCIRDNLKKVAEDNSITIDDKSIDLIVSKCEGHLRDAHILLQNYMILDEDSFKKLVGTARKSFLGFYICCYLGDLGRSQQFLGELIKYPLSDLKRDYEALLLEIMECSVSVKEPKDELMRELMKLMKQKVLNLYYIMVDPIIINSFDNSDRFQAAQYDIYLKINQKMR